MKTLTVDAYQRVRLPKAKPRSKFSYEEDGNRLVLTPLLPAEVPTVKPRRVNGRLRGADVNVSRETVAAAIRADRDA